LFDNLHYGNITCVKTLESFFFPNGSESMREMSVFVLVTLMAWSGLHLKKKYEDIESGSGYIEGITDGD
jgi:hypothetical protein